MQRDVIGVVTEFMVRMQSARPFSVGAVSTNKYVTAREKEATSREKEATSREKDATPREKEATSREKEATSREKEACPYEEDNGGACVCVRACVHV
jgi:hypothetical protein